jgi:tetratricopeptide (TPR) repeat protein
MAQEKLSIEMTAPPCKRDSRGGSSPGIRFVRILCFGAFVIQIVTIASVQGQTTNSASSAGSSLQEHYDAAQNFQAAGDLVQAALEYKMFLAEALRRLAHDHASAGDSQKAVPLFEEALNLVPSDFEIRLDYAEASLVGKDYAKSKVLAQDALEADPRNARAHLILGRALMHLNENGHAKEQFEAAVALDATFENGYALATAYLALKDGKNATKIFDEMLAGFGDTAEIHMDFGRAYADASLPDQAIQEFKKAIAKNDTLPTAHYSLGAAYLQSMGEINDPEAAAQFRRELEINPNDFLSHYELGSIALTEHKLQEAESELAHAQSLNAQSPDPPLSLGEVYRQMNRPTDAEVELRKSISLTQDVSRNHYQVQRAYYMLGRLLLATGRQEEGKKAIEISDKYLQENVRENQGKPSAMGSGQPVQVGPLIRPEQPDAPEAEALKQLNAFKEKISPAIADGYNNLGAIAAGNNEFAAALHDFQAASEWNPSLEGLDYNWGRAAFSAERYDQVVGPLGRYLQAHPDDTWARSAVGLSLYHLKNYSDALRTIKPMETEGLVDADPNLAFAYSICLLKTGDYAQGVERLKGLETENPGVPAVHEALGSALVRHGDLAEAVVELRTAVKMDPSRIDTKYDLALALIRLQQKEEAQQLLDEVVQKGSRNLDAYYQLGKLQLDSGDTKAAIVTFEAGAQINPANSSIHFELAAAYREDSRIEDAEREMKLYETLRSAETKDRDPASQN